MVNLHSTGMRGSSGSEPGHNGPPPAPKPPADEPAGDPCTIMSIAVMLGTVPGTTAPVTGHPSIPEVMRHS